METHERELRALLNRVAAGELDPSEAARILDENSTGAAAGGTPKGSFVRRVRVVANGVRLRIVADSSVASAVADGPHLMHEEADGVVLTLPGRRDEGDPPQFRLGRFRMDLPHGSGERVLVRINPELPLHLTLTACAATVSGTRSALDVQCTSSALQIADHAGPLTGTVTAGSAKIDAVLTGRDDTLVCDMGSLKLSVLAGSNTTIAASSDMGSVKIVGKGATPTSRDDAGGAKMSSSALVGAGTGRLSLSVRMGSAKVTLP